MPDSINIEHFLDTAADFVKDKDVPVVDLIAIQTKDPFKVLVATILSARTKDETTAQAAARLFKAADTSSGLASLPQKSIEKLIYPVGFFRNKAKYLKDLPSSLERFGNRVPETIEELITLPGVGRKTANLVRSIAFNKPAICVDTHVHRIFNIWQYVETDTPLKTEQALRQRLPVDYWIPVNSILVAFGQSLCKPVRPHCDLCPLVKECPQHGVTPRNKPKPERLANDKQTLRLISWNVNGIRAVEKKGFVDIIKELDGDVIALQETKAQPDQLSDNLINIPGYFSYWHSAEKKGYSGVAIYSKRKPLRVISGIGNAIYDCEGRVLTLEFETFFFLGIYFPNAGEGLKRLEYKLNFNEELKAFSDELRQTKPVVLCGDFNVAHKAIDLKNPKNNIKNAGYTPQERAWMDTFIDGGYLDTFRMVNQDPEQYSWWSYRFNSRGKNVGWRIDYFCVDSESGDRVTDAKILQDIYGSDHCPVLLMYTP